MTAAWHRLLLDEMLGLRVAFEARRGGIDVVHVIERGLAGAADPAVMESARADARILVTRNYRDFAPLVEVYVKREVDFAGVLFVPTSIPHADIGAHVQAMRAWLDRHASRNPVQGTFGWLGPSR